MDQLSKHEQRIIKHQLKDKQQEQPKKISKKRLIAILIIVVIIFGVGYLIYQYNTSPGRYDKFAKCLSEKGAIVYGNDFCQYTGKQLSWFGKSEKYLNYVKCAENKNLCESKGIKTTPTWEVNGNFYPEVQSFERLSTITGCNWRER